MSTSKIALVTGATDGIGIPTAIELARRGMHVILHGRRDERLAASRAAVLAAVPEIGRAHV
jgi:short-subunit dehydrogenase